MRQRVDSAELRLLYEQYAPVIHRRAFRFLGREADAWDLVQEVFRKLLESRDAFRREAQPMTYVYRITTNLCLNVLRSRKLRERSDLGAGAEESESGPASVEARDVLIGLFRRLDERAQQIAALYFIDELTQQEISSVVGLSRKTVGKELESIRAHALAFGLPLPESEA